MPAYPGNGLAGLIYDNQQYPLFQGEVMPVGTASVGVQVAKETGHHHSFSGLSAELVFGGNPGTFEIDIQAADSDLNANYVNLASITSVNSFNVGRFMQVGIPAKYFRAYVAALANPVSITLILSR